MRLNSINVSGKYNEPNPLFLNVADLYTFRFDQEGSYATAEGFGGEFHLTYVVNCSMEIAEQVVDTMGLWQESDFHDSMNPVIFINKVVFGEIPT